MSESNLPVRVVEGEWRYDRQRYVKALPSLDVSTMVWIYGCGHMFTTWLRHAWWQFAFYTAATAAVTGVRAVRQQRAVRHLLAMCPPDLEPTEGQIGLVTLKFYRDDVLYGEDVGMLSVDEYYVHFEGSQTTFSTVGCRLLLVKDAFVFADRPDLKVVIGLIPQRRRALRNLPIATTLEPVFRSFDPDPTVSELIVGLPPTRPLGDFVRTLRRNVVGYWWATVGAVGVEGILAYYFFAIDTSTTHIVLLMVAITAMVVAVSMMYIGGTRKSIAAIERWNAEDSP